MQQFKFTIPQKLEDLLHPCEDPNIYYVNDELTSLEIAQKLPETENILKDDPLEILSQFNIFYSVLRNFDDLDPRLVDRAWVIVYRTTDSFKEQLKDIFRVLDESFSGATGGDRHNASQNISILSQNGNNLSQNRGNLFESLEERSRYSNALKMLIFINCNFIQLFEDALSSQAHKQNFNETYSENATSTPAVRKKKRQRVNKNSDNGREISFTDYDRYKDRLLRDLLQLIIVPLNKVAESITEAQDIVAQLMRVSYKLIENSSINSFAKNRVLQETAFSILGCGIERYNQSMSFCLKYIQLLQYKEQLAPMLADSVEFIITKHEQRLLIGEILREIDRIDVKELSRDSSCPRAISTFLMNLSEKCAQEFVGSLDHILGYLEQDSYIMRNSSLVILSNLVMKALHEKEEDRMLRDDLLDALLRHIKDVTGFTRARALGVWCNLCESERIPLSYLTSVTKAAVNRLRDKTCLVRKNALRLIIILLNRNPFAKKLPLRAFLERYELEATTLQRLMDEEKEKEDREEEILETLSQDSQNETITSETDPSEIHPSLKLRNLALSEESAVVTQERKVSYLKNAISFTRLIHEAIPLALEMLCSKNVTDIQESIDFFVNCHEFGIDEALVGFKRMILLINSQEKSIKETILSAYKKIFFESSRYEGKSNRDSLVVTNFINFVQTSSIGECISLEVLLGQFHQSQDFTKDMERELWTRFTKVKSNTSIEDSISSIQLLGMLATTQPELISHNLQLCVQYGLSVEGKTESESRLIRETCIAIRKHLPRKIEDKKRTLRLSKDDILFVKLSNILIESLTQMDCEHWFSMCDEIVRIFFDMAENPEKIAESIFSRMADRLLKNAVPSTSLLNQDTQRNDSPDLVFQPSTIHATGGQSSQNQQTTELVHPMVLARFIHFLGDVALDLAVFLELHVLLELKIRNATRDNHEISLNNISAHNISISSRRRSRRYNTGNKSMDDQNLEDEIGLGGAEAEDQEMEFILSICDEEIVCSANLLAKMSRVILEIAMDPTRYPNPELKKASTSALAKYMMVSAKYCNDHLRLLFTILEKTKDRDIKINLLIHISDLCIRFPNQLDGWTGKIFDCLQSEEVSVRRTALKIISRLVLCDILKPKDQIGNVANLIVDEDEQIASYSRHFFLELSKKMNAIYNVLPDIISRLSDAKTGLGVEDFRVVMKFVFDLIDKSHHIDRLVDKLCGRFMDTDDERHWCDLAYCLSLLKYSDKSMTKLFDKFDCYKDKLCFDSVHESIMSIIANYRKTPHLKNEMKQMLDEFEAKIAKYCLAAEEEREQSQRLSLSSSQTREEKATTVEGTDIEEKETTTIEAEPEEEEASID